MPSQHNCPADEKAIGNIEIGPSVGSVSQKNPIANTAFPFERHTGFVPHSKSIIEITNNPPHNASEGDGQPQRIGGAESEKPNENRNRGEYGCECKEPAIACSHSEESADVHRRFDSDHILDYPPRWRHARHTAPLKDPLLAEEITRPANESDENEEAKPFQQYGRIVIPLVRFVRH